MKIRAHPTETICRIAVLTFAALVALPFCATAGANVVTKSGTNKDGRATVDHSISLKTASLHVYQTLDGDGRPIIKNWGDEFYGLSLGRHPRNGGWNAWKFLSVMADSRGKGGGGCDAIASRAAEDVFAMDLGGNAFASMTYRVDDGRTMEVRYVQTPATPDWLYMRIKCVGFTPSRISLSAFTGGASSEPSRERVIATPQGEYPLSSAGAKFSASNETRGIALFNRYAHTGYGNLIVYDADAIATVESPRGNYCFDLRFTPKEGRDSFRFALGSYADKPDDEAVTRFFTEGICEAWGALNDIEWEPKATPNEFDAMAKRAGSLDLPEIRFAEIRMSCRKAVGKGDLRGMAAAEKVLEGLIDETVENGLGKWR